MNNIFAKVIADSISHSGSRITTIQVRFHRFILPEFNTHRVFSRNFSSSRAIPIAKTIAQVRANPAIPIHFGRNQPGMQAHGQLSGRQLELARAEWLMAAENAADVAEHMNLLGLHKQVVNRVLEPFLYVNGIVTATEWANFFELRRHEDAQPEIHALADRMYEAMEVSTPKVLKPGEWHLPYIEWHEFADYNDVPGLLRKVSAARCCRVSYLKHDGHPSTVEEDLALCDRLAGAVPIHASPFEHQATPVHPHEFPDELALQGNFVGWIQNRKILEQDLQQA